ncbi:MAG: CdaR family protein [Nitrospirota bacterium]|nr:CdaR family protein [Nitrospirota bacterium]
MKSMDFRRLFLENWQTKLISLVLSVTLWFYVTSKGKTEISFTVPLELRNIPQGLAVVGDVPATLEVRVQGQERLLRDGNVGRKIAGTLDLSQAREGENTLRLSPDDIRRPSGMSVTHLAPYDIRVSLERLIKRSVRLRPVFTGEPAGNLRVVSFSVTPPRITVEGPVRAMKGLTALPTLPIDVSGLSGRTTVKPRIDYQGRPVKILDQDISVTLVVQKERP